MCLTSDDELSKVGDRGSPGRQRDAAVEVLLPALRLHLERGHQPLVAEPRQRGRVQQDAVTPLTAGEQRAQGEKSAVSAQRADPRVVSGPVCSSD